MVRILGYSWVGIRTEDFEDTIRFFTEKLGLPLTYCAEDHELAYFRLPSGNSSRSSAPTTRRTICMPPPVRS